MKKKITYDMALAVGTKKLHSGRKFMYDAVEATHRKYIGKNSFYKTKFLEKRSCPLCNSKKKNTLFKKRGGIYRKCKNCELVYLDPVFKDKELSKYYKNLHDAQSIVTKNESNFYKRIYTLGLKAIEKFKKPNRILDVGCSSGYFLDIAKSRGWKTYGIELGSKEAKLAKLNHEVFEKDIQYLDKLKKFDVITMWDVIEHIKNGHIAMQHMRKRLVKNGFIFFQTPNVNSLAARILQEKCNVFDGLEHVNLYDKSTIYKLAKQNGFKVIYYESVISEIPVISNYLNYTNPYHGESKFNDSVLGLIDEKKLHKELLGYKMQTILQKV